MLSTPSSQILRSKFWVKLGCHVPVINTWQKGAYIMRGFYPKACLTSPPIPLRVKTQSGSFLSTLYAYHVCNWPWCGSHNRPLWENQLCLRTSEGRKLKRGVKTATPAPVPVFSSWLWDAFVFGKYMQSMRAWSVGVRFVFFIRFKKRRLIDDIRETNQKTPRNLKGVRNGRQINRYVFEWALCHF